MPDVASFDEISSGLQSGRDYGRTRGVLSSLRLMDFRCFSALDIDVPAEGVLLTGENAQGKTSVLEAICLLVRLHSPRTHRMSTLVRFGAKGFGVAGDAWGEDRQVRYGRSGLALRVGDTPRAGASPYLADGGLLVWMGNEDLELVRGPGEERRRYLDFIGAQVSPDYRRAWTRYRRALKAKNLLLKESRLRQEEIFSYEEILIEHGTTIMQTRARLIAEIGPLAAAFQCAISGRSEPLTLTYQPASGPDLRESILQSRDREWRLRQAVVGPHRDEMALTLHGMPAAEFASEGQQRTLALALKLAQGNRLESHGGRAPIYLLDDIFGELDPQRRNALMQHLPANAQKWITTTHLGWLKESPIPDGLARLRVAAATCYPA